MDANWTEDLTRLLGAQIAEARQLKGMSALRLSEETNGVVHRRAIPRIEQGEQVVTVPELVALGVALDADWLGWLVRVTNKLPIQTRRNDQVAYYKRLLLEVDDELKALKDNLFQAEQAPVRFQMADQLKDRIAADVDRYHSMIDALHERRRLILQELGGSADA